MLAAYSVCSARCPEPWTPPSFLLGTTMIILKESYDWSLLGGQLKLPDTKTPPCYSLAVEKFRVSGFPFYCIHSIRKMQVPVASQYRCTVYSTTRFPRAGSMGDMFPLPLQLPKLRIAVNCILLFCKAFGALFDSTQNSVLFTCYVLQTLPINTTVQSSVNGLKSFSSTGAKETLDEKNLRWVQAELSPLKAIFCMLCSYHSPFLNWSSSQYLVSSGEINLMYHSRINLACITSEVVEFTKQAGLWDEAAQYGAMWNSRIKARMGKSVGSFLLRKDLLIFTGQNMRWTLQGLSEISA